MNNINLYHFVKNPLEACIGAYEAENGELTLAFENTHLARSYVSRFGRAHRHEIKRCAALGDLEGVSQQQNFIISRTGPSVTVRYLPKSCGIVSAGESSDGSLDEYPPNSSD